MASNASGTNTSGVNDDSIRYPLDPNADPDASEFSWGEGLEPPLLRGKPPNEGGRYRGTSQLCEKHIAVSR